jgi:hypothetical protein
MWTLAVKVQYDRSVVTDPANRMEKARSYIEALDGIMRVEVSRRSDSEFQLTSVWETKEMGQEALGARGVNQDLAELIGPLIEAPTAVEV